VYPQRGTPFIQVDLNEVIAGLVSDLDARLIETGGSVEILSLPTVYGDPTQMRQLLQNLIGNALKFHSANAVPVVRLSAELIDNGKACRISVADNGIGFDEKYLDRVFTVFQRLHGRGDYEGTGVGLAVCRKIVERHGGSITARSKPGEGATFIVTMPLETPAEGIHGSS
jgi:light-regulated signal transduction histidine kinase (bacteriophytochrome)